MLQTDFAVYLGIVYTYLPFMILPLYANLVKLDESLLEASADLGGRPMTTFFHVTLPLSMPGVIAGFMLVFVPAIGEFVIPELLGGPNTLMIGRVLWNEFFSNRDWPIASAVAIAMLVVLVIPIMILRSAQARRSRGDRRGAPPRGARGPRSAGAWAPQRPARLPAAGGERRPRGAEAPARPALGGRPPLRPPSDGAGFARRVVASPRPLAGPLRLPDRVSSQYEILARRAA